MGYRSLVIRGSMAMSGSDKRLYAFPAVGGEVAKNTTGGAIVDGARGGGAGSRVEVPGCLGEVAQVAGDARVGREAVAEPLRRSTGRLQRLVDGGLEPVEFEENHVL
jgi:hypothetical protein